ncbi:MAG TPA: Gfo/Idh/MocA family oxidoreductase [Gemmatimonadaceae bacterium]
MNRTSDAIRVAVVGCGLIGRKRLEAIQALDEATLAATVDPAREPAAKTGVAHYRSLNELSPESYDAAIISVPHDAAPALTEAVLSAGKPVLVEKPLATSAHVARKLERLAGKVQLPSFVGYNYRFLPSVRCVMKSAADGRLGKLRSIDILIGHGGHPESANEWKLDLDRAGGGVLLDPGVHLLDLLLRLAPGISCTGVEATRGFWGTGVEEDVAAMFRGDKLLITLRVSHIRWINTFRIEVFGEDAYSIAEGRGGNYGPMTVRFGKRWGWADGPGLTQRESETVQDFGTMDASFREELEGVLHSWRTGETVAHWPHPASFREAGAVIELLEELYARMR